jgi:O-antigen ligase
MTAAAPPPKLGPRRRPRPEKLGLPVAMIILWLGLEYSRPPNPMKVPLMLSLALLAGWLLHGTKRWNPQIVLMLLFVAQMVLMIPFTENNFAARMTTREVLIVIAFIAIPMAHFIDTLRRLQIVLYSWIAFFVYMAVWALGHGGNGPGGASAGVDENYTALFMTMAISLAFFGALTVRRSFIRVALFAFVGLFVMVIVLGASRGGFVGLVAVAFYCWWRSPGKIVSSIGALVALAVFLYFVPASYVNEVKTISDTSESTADARLTFWGIAVQMWADNPVFGVGPGNFPWVSGFYQSVDEEGSALGMNVTHSLYFELLAEMGTTGVLCWFGILWMNFRDFRFVTQLSSRTQRRAKRLGRRRLTGQQRTQLERLRNADAWARALTSATIGFVVCSLFLSTLYYTTFWLLSAMTVALREATIREAALLRRSMAAESERAPATTSEVRERSRPTASLAGLLGR